ncbi:MAG: hypothetical protein KC438_14505, partial [Thermomicrobiales bacterium]|nr:hypothetical protein [Thermomicrobiales bacterium]
MKPFSAQQLLLTFLAPDHLPTQLAIYLIIAIALGSFLFVLLPLLWRLAQIGVPMFGLLTRARTMLAHEPEPGRQDALAKLLSGSPIDQQWARFLREWRSASPTLHSLPTGGSPVRLRDVFEDIPLIRPGARRSLVGGLPGIFIAIGVLGTFVGLTIATADLAAQRAQS